MTTADAIAFASTITTVIIVTAGAVAFVIRGHEKVVAKVEAVELKVDGVRLGVANLDADLRSHMADESVNLEKVGAAMTGALERQSHRIDELFNFLVRHGRSG